MSTGNPSSTMMRSLGCVIQSALSDAACLLWPTVYALLNASVRPSTSGNGAVY
jgi:hypothetical protein